MREGPIIFNTEMVRMDAYVGEIFPGSYSKEHVELKKIIEETGGRVCVFRNHAKIFAGRAAEYDFVIESSANINTNPRSENTVITIDKGLYEFYKSFYDGINSFTKDPEGWRPYEIR